MKPTLVVLVTLLLASQFEVRAADELVVYPPVPGLAASVHYAIRMRSVGAGSEWQSAFACETACKTIDKKTDGYFDTLAGWTHTYVNFETSGAVEIEIARVNGQPIWAAAVHPRRKASVCLVKDGKAFVRLDQPCLVAVDIDGQMDSQDTGKGYNVARSLTISRPYRSRARASSGDSRNWSLPFTHPVTTTSGCLPSRLPTARSWTGTCGSGRLRGVPTTKTTWPEIGAANGTSIRSTPARLGCSHDRPLPDGQPIGRHDADRVRPEGECHRVPLCQRRALGNRLPQRTDWA